MGDFEVDDVFSIRSTSYNEPKYDVGVCCGKPMAKRMNKLVCFECWNEEIMMDFEPDHLTSHNSGCGSNKPLIKVNVFGDAKKYTAYPSHVTKRDNNIVDEFQLIKSRCHELEDDVINTAKSIYNNIVVKNDISRKGDKRYSIQLACVFIELENREKPMSKKEFSSKLDLSENLVTTGYNIVREIENTYDMSIIMKKEMHDNIKGFINRLRTEDNPKISKFLLNMINLVRNNLELHNNKHPECIASSILCYTYTVYNINYNVDEISSKIYISKKNILSHYSFLLKIRNNPMGKFHKYFILLIETFKL